MILYIQPHFIYPGGSGKFVLETAVRLAEKGLNVGVLALGGDSQIISAYPHIKYFFIGGPLPDTFSHWLTLPHLVRRVDEELSKLRVDILFPQVFPANYWGFLYKRHHKDIPCIWYCHEPSAFVHNPNVILGLKGAIKYAALLSNPFLQLLDRKLVRYADKILANSQYTASMVRKIYQRDADVVYPGVDIEKFRPNWKKEEYIFTIGRLTKLKKIDLLLKALALLKHQRNQEIPLIIGGDGEERPNLMKLTQELGLDKQVRFTGRLLETEVHEYLGKAKVVVFPTTNEPFGLVPLEAMACGTPVIASDSGGPKETVLDGKTGFHFEADDELDLAHRIQILVENDNLLKEMSIASRRHVEQNFSWEKTAQKLYRVFEEFLH